MDLSRCNWDLIATPSMDRSKNYTTQIPIQFFEKRKTKEIEKNKRIIMNMIKDQLELLSGEPSVCLSLRVVGGCIRVPSMSGLRKQVDRRS